MAGVKRAARMLEIFAVIGFVLLVVAIGMPNIDRIPDGARLAETKQVLHSIQLAVEQYATNHDDVYPAYLVGGEARWSAAVDLNSAAKAFQGQGDCADLKQAADPLLREGYLSEYPRNPFVRDGRNVHRQQLTLPLDCPGGDPLRNSLETGRLYGTRFGVDCTRMGQVLGAKYYCPVFDVPLGAQPGASGQQTLNLAGVKASPIPGLPPGADVTYPCWDSWQGKHPANPLPGQFIYAGTGPVIALSSNARGQLTGLPHEIDSYILAAFGGQKTNGKDLLDGSGNPFYVQAGIESSGKADVQYGNPNGIRDGIILALTAGGSYPGDNEQN